MMFLKTLSVKVFTVRGTEEREDELLSKDMTDLEEAIARRKSGCATDPL